MWVKEEHSEPKKKGFHVKLNIFDYDSVFYINKNVFYYNIILG